MKINVNGKIQEFAVILNLKELLEYFELKVDQVVIELNRMVPEKDHYSQIQLQEGDQVELIKFLGGG